MNPETPNETAELQVVPQQILSAYLNKEAFEHAQRVALMFSKSDLIPKQYFGNVGNCMIALEMASRMGASPLMVMQNLIIINGRPSWSSVFLIATLNACGRFSPLRYEEDEVDGGRVRAWAIDKSTNEKLYGAWASMNMAKAEGWIDKAGSKWKTMPELMRRYRAASFFTKQFAPELSMGLQTTEEIIDISHQEVKAETPKQEKVVTAIAETVKKLKETKEKVKEATENSVLPEEGKTTTEDPKLF